jgi:DNA-binding FadR family transcriptional regulator
MLEGDEAEDFRVPKAAELVAARVRKAVVTGELKDGDSLPNETQMMARFKISRPTAREAIRILESEGIIRVSRGARGGGRVVSPDATIVARAAGLALQTRGVTISDLYEARMLIEAPAARLAAERRPKTAANALRVFVSHEFEVIEDRVLISRAIAGFHRLLMDECGNGTLGILALALHDAARTPLWSVITRQTRRPDRGGRRRRCGKALDVAHGECRPNLAEADRLEAPHRPVRLERFSTASRSHFIGSIA